MEKKDKKNSEYGKMEAKRLGEGPLDSLPRDIGSDKDNRKYRFRKIKEMINGKTK